MAKLKNIEIVAMASAIADLQRDRSPYPVRFGFALALNAKRLDGVVSAYQASYSGIVQTFGVKRADGALDVDENAQVKITDVQGFADERAKLDGETVDMDLHMIKLDDFPPSISAGAVSALMPMIETGDA